MSLNYWFNKSEFIFVFATAIFMTNIVICSFSLTDMFWGINFLLTIVDLRRLT